MERKTTVNLLAERVPLPKLAGFIAGFLAFCSQCGKSGFCYSVKSTSHEFPVKESDEILAFCNLRCMLKRFDSLTYFGDNNATYFQSACFLPTSYKMHLLDEMSPEETHVFLTLNPVRAKLLPQQM